MLTAVSILPTAALVDCRTRGTHMTSELQTQAKPFDSREKEQWFEALSDSAKNQVRRQWKSVERSARVDEERRRDQFVQTLCECAGLYFFVELAFYGLTLGSAFMTLFVGSLVGLAWAKWQCCRVVSGLSGMAGFVLIRAFCGTGIMFQTMLASIMVVCISTALGISRESSRGGI